MRGETAAGCVGVLLSSFVTLMSSVPLSKPSAPTLSPHEAPLSLSLFIFPSPLCHHTSAALSPPSHFPLLLSIISSHSFLPPSSPPFVPSPSAGYIAAN